MRRTLSCLYSRTLHFYEGVVHLMASHITAVLATKSPQPMPLVLLKRLPLCALLLFRPPSESEQTRPRRLLQQIRQQIVATLFSITAEKKGAKSNTRTRPTRA